jgi:protein O-mannosyl-transferase
VRSTPSPAMPPATAMPSATGGAVDRLLDSLAASPWRVALLVWLVTAAVFLPAVRCGFVNWDDGKYVFQNPLVLQGLTLDGFRHACSDVIFCNWAPLTVLSYQLDATLFGTAPWGFHLSSVLLHATSVALLVVCLCRMTGALWPSAAAALMFGLHPLRVESVVWIAERKDVLSVFFLVLALLAYERYCRSPGVWRYAMVGFWMLASLLSKATLVTLPVLLLLLDIWPLERLCIPGVGRPVDDARPAARYGAVSWRASVVEKFPLLVLAATFALVTMATQGDAIQTEQSLPLVTARLPNALYATVWYVWKTFCPTGLRPFYRHAASELSPLVVVSCGAAIVATALAAVRLAARRPFVTVGLAWFAVALLPMLGIVAQPGFQSRADRFTYVPHVGLLMALVWWAAAVAGEWRLPRRWQLLGMVAVAVALAVVTLRQIPMWTNSDTLWTTMIRQDPTCAMAHMKYANHLVATRRLPAAEPHYLAAIEQATDDWPGHVCRITSLSNLACLYYDLGDHARARTARDLAIEIDPDDEAVQQMVEHVQLPDGK